MGCFFKKKFMTKVKNGMKNNLKFLFHKSILNKMEYLDNQENKIIIKEKY